jgi:hypothetical protein
VTVLGTLSVLLPVLAVCPLHHRPVEPKRPIYVHRSCPAERPEREVAAEQHVRLDCHRRLDARLLIGQSIRSGERFAARYGFEVRVVIRNGKPETLTEDLRRNRIDVDVNCTTITLVHGVG